MERIVKKRIKWIDELRGLGIIYIVLGHSLHGVGIWKWLYGFHVPLFISISALTFYASENIDIKYIVRFLRKKSIQILLPYFFWGIISILIYQIMMPFLKLNTDTSLLECVKELVWANGEGGKMKWNLPLWFLPMFFMLQIIARVAYSRSGRHQSFAMMLLSYLMASFIYQYGKITNLPFGFETAIYLFPFFSAGMCWRYTADCRHHLNKRKEYFFEVILLAMGTLGIMLQDNIDYVCDEYRNYMLFFISASCIVFGTISFFEHKSISCNLLEYIGKRSLAIMVLHKFPLLFFEEVFIPTKFFYKQYQSIAAYLITIVSVFMCLIAEKIIAKVCPILIGSYKIENVTT